MIASTITRLADWRKMDFFDKTIESFLVGGILTITATIWVEYSVGHPIAFTYDAIASELGVVLMWGFSVFGVFLKQSPSGSCLKRHERTDIKKRR